MDGVAANDVGRRFEGDSAELGGAAGKSGSGNPQTGGNGNAQQFALVGNDVEGRGGADVDDDAVAGVEVVGGGGVYDAVCADFGWVVGGDDDAGVGFGRDLERVLAEVILADGDEGSGQGRDDAGDDGGGLLFRRRSLLGAGF